LVLTARTAWNITQCSFINNEQFTNHYFLIIVFYSGKAYVSHNTFVNNKASQGGAVYSQELAHTSQVYLLENVFYSNTALQGGAMFIFMCPSMPIVNQNVFINNTSIHNGDTFAGNPDQLIFTKPLSIPVAFYSGEELPAFSFTIVDTFNTIVQPFHPSIDLFVAILESQPKTSTISNGILIPSTPKALLAGIRQVDYRGVTFLADPGNYTLRLSSLVNYANMTRFSVTAGITVRRCEEPNMNIQFPNEPFPRCMKRNSPILM
jgi:hypothetical protein